MEYGQRLRKQLHQMGKGWRRAQPTPGRRRAKKATRRKRSEKGPSMSWWCCRTFLHITAGGAGRSCLVTKQVAERERMENESADYEKMERTCLKEEEEEEDKENGCARELIERRNGRCFVAAMGHIAVSQVLCSLIVGKAA